MSERPVPVVTASAPAPIGPYSAAVQHAGMVYCSGQIPIDPVSGQIAGETVEEQARCVLDNLKAVLEAGGSGLDRVVKTTVYLSDMNDFPKVNAIYAQYFTDLKPARATVQVARLPRDVKVEIDAIGACR